MARMADRLPFSRKISRHLEGTDSKAGILSDVLALLIEVARRNPEIIERGVEDLVSGANEARATKMAQAKAKAQEASGGTHEAR